VVESYVRGFIFTDSDGAKRVNTAAMQTFLAEQFGYLTTSGATPAAQQAQAGQIAAALQGVVGREHWQSYPDYPLASASNNESVRSRLIEIRSAMHRQVIDMTDAYRAFEAGLATRIKALFNQLVLPTFPAGVQLIETTRAYVETFVTDWGEESRPSPVSSLVTLDQNDSTTIACATPPAGRHITLRRLYRSATGTGQSAFRLQGEYPIATTSITDTTPDTQLNDVCPTFGWLEPPADLQGLAGMANGIQLGFVDATLYACEPYAPYAFPAKYDKPLPYRIVGLASLKQSVFVGTVAYPYLVSGSDSASLSEERLPDLVPCASARSMVALGGSVFYASPDGLALYENGRVTVVSSGIDRATWQAYNPDSMHAAAFDGKVFMFFDRSAGDRGCLVFDYLTRTIAELDQQADAVFANQDGIYILDGSDLLDLLPAAGAARSGHWHSKTFHLMKPQSFGWLKVDGEQLATHPATVRVYADFGAGMALHHTAVVNAPQALRYPPGRASDWRIEIDSAGPINGVTLATTTEELKAAP
jgi:hypothetical protein